MYIEQIYTNCLSEASYYIESEGVAAVIDPIREPDTYLRLAEKRGAKIRYILETHFHADFISGHLDLAQKTGASIIYGPQAQTGFLAYSAKDGETLAIGKITLTVLHTPGHTPESSCFLLRDENGKDQALFSGDTLFIGDVGRPDLAVKSDFSLEDLAGMLYDSLHTKILPLDDAIMVYPAHGPGSACGKNIGKETFATLGSQKKTNYALQPMEKATFVKVVSEGILPAPAYFSIAAGINKSGYGSIESVLAFTHKELSISEFKHQAKSGAVILDVRTPDEFETGYIKGSINIGLNGQFAIWAGTVLDYFQPLLLVAPEGKVEETITRLARVGIENIKGYLSGGIDAWKKAGEPIETISSIDPENFEEYIERGYQVLDVRKPGEFETAHYAHAKNIHLQELESRLGDIDRMAPTLIHCAGGYRSMIALSILKRNGIRNFINVRKGWGTLKDIPGLAISTGPCDMQKKKAEIEKAAS